MERDVKVETLAVERISTDGTQARATLSETIITEYAEALSRSDEFPPIDVYYDGAAYWLADGFHRLHAAGRVGRETITATVHRGGKREALLHALGANETHGHRRTDADRRHAATLMLNDPEWSVWSNRVIARQCHVSEILIRRVRSEIKPRGEQRAKEETRMAKRGGQVYPIRIKKSEPVHTKQPVAEALGASQEPITVYVAQPEESLAAVSATVAQIESDTVTTTTSPEPIVTHEEPVEAPPASESQIQDAAPTALVVGQGEDTATDTPLRPRTLAQAWDGATHEQRHAFVFAYREVLQAFLAALQSDDTSTQPRKRASAGNARPQQKRSHKRGEIRQGSTMRKPVTS